MGNKRYNTVQMKGSSEFSKYPSWNEGKPNLMSYLEAINLSNPIVQSQFEMVWSRWPRTIFFAKGLNIPGVEASTLELSHAGFTITIPTHVTYGSTEINFTIIADKEGYHYYDIRNMVLQTGHPLVAGDPRATIGNNFKISPDEDTIEVRLRNSTEDSVHHHWVIHNFHPTKIGDIDLSHDSSSFVEFEVTGTFTHIDYDCGDNQGGDEGQQGDSQNQQGGGGEGAGGGNSSDRPDDSEVYERLELGDSGPSSPASGGSGGSGGGNDEEEEEEEEEIPDFGTYVYDPETGEGYWVEPGEPVDVDDVELPPGTEEWGEDLDPDFDWESDDWEDWNPDDWGADADSEFLAGSSDISVKTQDIEVDGETQTLVKLQGNLTPEQAQALREGGTKALLDSLNQGNEFTKEVQQEVAEEQSGISQDKQQSGGTSGEGSSQQQEEEVQQVPGFKTSKLPNGNYNIVKQTAFSTMSIQTSGDMAVETQILNRLEKEYSDAKAGKSTAETQVRKRMVEIQKNKMKVIQQWLDAKNQGQQKEGLQRRGMPPKMTQSHLNQMKSLFKAIKSNNDLHGQFITCVKPVEEMKKYRERIMHLMLPRRFGLARPQNRMPERAPYEISEPDQSWIEAKPNPNHRKRSIF